MARTGDGKGEYRGLVGKPGRKDRLQNLGHRCEDNTRAVQWETGKVVLKIACTTEFFSSGIYALVKGWRKCICTRRGLC